MRSLKTLLHFAQTGGPGWIQAAVTLGGGSLVGSLYLGVIGGYKFLWLQPLAMLCGVIMLSAISYVALSKESRDDRPFNLTKKHLSPVLAWGWLLATIVANIVFCSSQFALGADAIQGNLGGMQLNPYFISGAIFLIAMLLITAFSGEGKWSRVIDHVIKALVAVIVLSFMGVVITLAIRGAVDWQALGSGLIPDFSALFHPVSTFQTALQDVGAYRSFWEAHIIDSQRNIIIGAFGTAVGINMTFLLPYTLYKKKWGRAERKFAIVDLIFGLLLPFILAASCLVLATASQFHANKDGVINEVAYHEVLDARLAAEHQGFLSMTADKKRPLRAAVSKPDRELSIMLAKRSASDLAVALRPFLGRWSQLIFGIGVLAMALSTILIHMMMNGYAISEALGRPGRRDLFLLGAAIPALLGFFSPVIWAGTVKAALVVPAAVIATTLLPIAYLIFLLLMNSKRALGTELPGRRIFINVLMLLATSVATFASIWALYGKYQSTNAYEYYFGLIGMILLPILAIIGIVSFVRSEYKKPLSSR